MIRERKNTVSQARVAEPRGAGLEGSSGDVLSLISYIWPVFEGSVDRALVANPAKVSCIACLLCLQLIVNVAIAGML